MLKHTPLFAPTSPDATSISERLGIFQPPFGFGQRRRCSEVTVPTRRERVTAAHSLQMLISNDHQWKSRVATVGDFEPLHGDVANGRVAQFRSSVKAASGGCTWPEAVVE
jgi:hypothetical protein